MSGLPHAVLAGLAPETLVAVLIGFLTMFNVVVVWRSLTVNGPRVSRLRAVMRRRLELQAGTGAKRPRTRPRPRQAILEQILKRCERLHSAQSERVADRLLQAGLRSSRAPGLFPLAKLSCPLLLAAAVWTLLLAMAGSEPAWAPRTLLATLGAGLSFFLPDLYVANRTTRRRQALQSALPDGLDLLVICAEAGLTLDVALVRVSEELTRASPELADELTITSVELNFLPERRQALLNLARRGGVAPLRGVVTALIQTERYRTPLAQSLRVLSAEFREQCMLRAEEKAARLPALLTVPMIIFILPTLFIVLIGPAIIGILGQMAP